MKKEKLLLLIKKILLSKRIIKKSIESKELLNFNIFDNEKIDSMALVTIISELESISKKNINLFILDQLFIGKALFLLS